MNWRNSPQAVQSGLNYNHLDENTQDFRQAKKGINKALKARIAGSARKGNNVTDIFHAGQIHEQAFKTQAKAGMWTTTPAADIQVPVKTCRIDPVLAHASLQHLETFFALAATDNLADPWHQQIHSSNGLAVIIQAHVKSLDLLWVVGHKNRPGEHLFA